MQTVQRADVFILSSDTFCVRWKLISVCFCVAAVKRPTLSTLSYTWRVGRKKSTASAAPHCPCRSCPVAQSCPSSSGASTHLDTSEASRRFIHSLKVSFPFTFKAACFKINEVNLYLYWKLTLNIENKLNWVVISMIKCFPKNINCLSRVWSSLEDNLVVNCLFSFVYLFFN